jgi:undecaprenyl diphosphate synthase
MYNGRVLAGPTKMKVSHKNDDAFKLNKPLAHVAFIMDGNGRWAKKRLLPRYMGHREGCFRITDISNACQEFGIKAMSLYAFSTENWKRPQDEIDHLFNYIDEFFSREIDHMMRDGVRVIISGDISRLPESTQKTIERAVELTKNNHHFYFNICLNYGGRPEILRATQHFAADVLSGKAKINDLNEATFKAYLYTAELPEVDLLIRTSGEQRTSNFLPWQLAYSEFVFTSTYWPDFTRAEFVKCLQEFETRQRRYGGLKNE